jgi:anti-sigma regulatory factor (Ser/Thr protein kinase)
MGEDFPFDAARDFSLVVANSRSAAQLARRRFGAFLQSCSIAPPALAEDILLAVGEALANAAEHGFRPDGTLSLSATIAAGRIKIRVTDDGRGFAPRPNAAEANSYAPRGFGIHIMRTLMDSVDFHDQGRQVVLVKRLDPD